MSKSKQKKSDQLGMNPSTASGRLLKDILFKYVASKQHCYHCRKPMTREDFSIEHKVPWLDSESPVDLFFDLDNVSFSHLFCNFSSARKTNKKGCGSPNTYYEHGCRCDLCKKAARDHRKKYYTTEKRQERYRKEGR